VATRPPVGLPKLSRRSRILLIIGVVLLVGLITGSRLLDTYVNWLWFGEVGFRSVYSTVLLTRLGLFLGIGLLVGGLFAINLTIAYRARPVFVPVAGPEDPVARYRSVVVRRLRLFAIGLPLLVGLIAGASAQSDWQQVQLFLNGTSFGVTDPQFHHDIGFYAFKLPFYEWLLSWLFIATAMSFLGALVAHYLFGGIRLAGRGGQLSAPARMHLALAAGAFVLLKAVAYFFDRYTLLFSDRSDKFDGATYTDLNAVLPAKLILLCIAVFCAAAFFAGAFLRNMQLPAIATVLLVLSSVLVGAAWPAVLEQFSVRPNAIEKEAEPIRRNIDATKQAFGLTDDKVETKPYEGKQNVSLNELKNDKPTVGNVRLLDPNVLGKTFTQFQQLRPFYGFQDKLDVDRYTINGQTRDYIVAVRELNSAGLPDSQKDWINRHLIYTHGNGFVYADANKVNSPADAGGNGGYPIFQTSELGAPSTPTRARVASRSATCSTSWCSRRTTASATSCSTRRSGTTRRSSSSGTRVIAWRPPRRGSPSTPTRTRPSSTAGSPGSSTVTPRSPTTRTPSAPDWVRRPMTRCRACRSSRTDPSATSATPSRPLWTPTTAR
jgi:uncharacterized membrane protein (UPF0182 family)